MTDAELVEALHELGDVVTEDEVTLTEEPQASTSGINSLDEVFDIIRTITLNFFVLYIMGSKSFKQNSAARELTYKARLRYPAVDVPLSHLVAHLKELFETIITEMRKEYGNSAVARVYIYHPKLNGAIIVPPIYLGDLYSDDILDTIDNVVYSAGDIPADEELDINVAVVKLIEGAGRLHITDIDIDVNRKKSMVEIVNTDNICLPRAIVVGLAKLKLNQNPDLDSLQKVYNKIKDKRTNYQKNEAKKLLRSVKLPEDIIGTLAHIPLYEDYLKIAIVVISTITGKKPVYNGNSKYNDHIFLFHSQRKGKGHFDTITKINAMFCTQYYCNSCRKAFKSRTQHSCKVWCSICGEKDCEWKNEMKCNDCNMICRSAECFEKHKKGKKITFSKDKGTHPSYCEQFWQCLECKVKLKRSIRNPEIHECGEIECKVCETFYVGEEHLCYMRATSKNNEPRKFIFFDFECEQQTGIHKPNYAVVHMICKYCLNEPINDDSTCVHCGARCNICKKWNKKHEEFEKEPCIECGKRQIIFEGISKVGDVEITAGTKFCKWLIQEQNMNSKVLAHNARSYDSYFILSYMKENMIEPESIIMSGKKIMYMKIGKGLNIDILDSLNFLPMPLASLPKSFGLTELKKGYFPHFFNTPENQEVILQHLPEKDMYGPDSMSKDGREKFIKWYEEHKNDEFNFRKEMKEYCVSDVNILLQACLKFRELLINETGEKCYDIDPEDFSLIEKLEKAVDPFSYLTIASVCLGVFKTKFISEEWKVLLESNILQGCLHQNECVCKWHKARKVNAHADLEIFIDDIWQNECHLKISKRKFVKSPIALIPPNGYAGKDNHSKESIQWLSHLEKRIKEGGKDINIQHARTTKGEHQVFYKGKTQMVKYKLDGYFEYDGNKFACEYYGCNWHGCELCFPSDRESTMNKGISMAQLYRDTQVRENRLREMGYKIISIWGCQFKQEQDSNNEVKKFVDNLDIQDSINLRDAYFGGRTNALVLYKKFKENERGYYMDFTSLYPDVLKYKKYPLGHPERIFKDFKENYEEKCEGNCIYLNTCKGKHIKLPYFGVMKVTVLPPTQISHPVLPIKIGKASAKKLKFPLCFKCAEKESKVECQCSDSERSFTHTYCTPELEVAVNMGYKIIKIHEVLNWIETEEYNTQTKSGGLFTEYINKFLRLKQQASGYPQNVKSESEKDKYISDYMDHEGITLQKSCIENNSGLRSLSKLALNSFYGKFGQRTNMTKHKFITDISELYNIWIDKSKKLMDFHIVSEEVMELEYKYADDFEPISMNTNVIIAAFCTSWARLKLWEVMHTLGDRVLYHDTDSVIFSAKDNEYIPPLGKYLGQLTNELTCKELNCIKEKCEGHFIEEFVSCGPKNYGYKVNTGEVCCKVRGFSLNYKNSLILNFDSMKESLFHWMNNDDSKLTTIKTEICRDSILVQVYNKEVEKRYGVVYDKRRVFQDFTTKPYGYQM